MKIEQKDKLKKWKKRVKKKKNSKLTPTKQIFNEQELQK